MMVRLFLLELQDLQHVKQLMEPGQPGPLLSMGQRRLFRPFRPVIRMPGGRLCLRLGFFFLLLQDAGQNQPQLVAVRFGQRSRLQGGLDQLMQACCVLGGRTTDPHRGRMP